VVDTSPLNRSWDETCWREVAVLSVVCNDGVSQRSHHGLKCPRIKLRIENNQLDWKANFSPERRVTILRASDRQRIVSLESGGSVVLPIVWSERPFQIQVPS
jgi:hypothetical protein